MRCCLSGSMHSSSKTARSLCSVQQSCAQTLSWLPPHAGLLKSKTRLLVTNQLQFVPQADRVVYLEAGCVAAQGSFEEVSQHPGFASLLTEFNAKAEAEEVGRSLCVVHSCGTSGVLAPLGAVGEAVPAALSPSAALMRKWCADGVLHRQQEKAGHRQLAPLGTASWGLYWRDVNFVLR